MTAPESHAILLIESEATDGLSELLTGSGYRVEAVPSVQAALETLHSTMPDLFLLPIDTPGMGKASLVHDLKENSLFSHLLLVVTCERSVIDAGIDWQAIPADDYLTLPLNEREVLARVQLLLTRTARDMSTNPLSGLPGNIAIMRELERRLARDQAFAVAYVDIDHFKPFNDRYGFSRGDEVLRMTARVLLNTLAGLEEDDVFLGHIGGDDFIFVTARNAVERACKESLNSFDLVVPNFYDEEDRLRGQILSEDRQGKHHTFPIMTCSIAVVEAGGGRYMHIGEISARSAEVKKLAKGLPGSNYIIDRRR
jgi:diguanylate cyclase (GGDEF)-like protein